MTRVNRTIEVDLPISTTYNQWTQFQDFPKFMKGVREVTQPEPDKLHWIRDEDGHTKEWDARITRLVPDEVVAWEAESNLNAGTIVFKPLGDDRTEVDMYLEYSSSGHDQTGIDSYAAIGERVEGDLHRFKDFIEHRGMETGAWRAEILDGEEHPVAPFEDSLDAPAEDQIRHDVSPL